MEWMFCDSILSLFLLPTLKCLLTFWVWLRRMCVCVCVCDFVLLVMIKERGRRKEDGGTVFILLSSNCLVSGGFLFLSSFSPLFMSCYISCLYYGIVLCRVVLCCVVSISIFLKDIRKTVRFSLTQTPSFYSFLWIRCVVMVSIR